MADEARAEARNMEMEQQQSSYNKKKETPDDNMVRMPTMAAIHNIHGTAQANKPMLKLSMETERERQAALLQQRKNKRKNKQFHDTSNRSSPEVMNVMSSARENLARTQNVEQQERARLANKLAFARKKRYASDQELPEGASEHEKRAEQKRRQAVAEHAAKRKKLEVAALDKLDSVMKDTSTATFEQDIEIALKQCRDLHPKLEGAQIRMQRADMMLQQLKRIAKLKAMIQVY